MIATCASSSVPGLLTTLRAPQPSELHNEEEENSIQSWKAKKTLASSCSSEPKGVITHDCKKVS